MLRFGIEDSVRALGAVLAECTANRTEAQMRLAEAEKKTKKGIKDFAGLLNMTVGVIAQASKLDEATLLVVQAWKQLAEENKIGTDKLIQGLVATTKKSCEEMLQQLLLRPNEGEVNQSMDGTIQTIFGAKGDVERIRIKAIGGRFSSYLADSLAAANSKYQEQKERVQDAGGDPGPVTPEVAKISLVMDWRGYNEAYNEAYIRKLNQNQPESKPDPAKIKPNYETFEYKATSAEFISAYLDATLKYAAVAYADRWRRNPLL